MKAFVVSEYAHPSKIPLTHNAPEPVLKPGSDDLLIDVHSAGLNFFDVHFPHPVRPTTHI
jgi:NADPH:quinone reductase